MAGKMSPNEIAMKLSLDNLVESFKKDGYHGNFDVNGMGTGIYHGLPGTPTVGHHPDLNQYHYYDIQGNGYGQVNNPIAPYHGNLAGPHHGYNTGSYHGLAPGPYQVDPATMVFDHAFPDGMNYTGGVDVAAIAAAVADYPGPAFYLDGIHSAFDALDAGVPNDAFFNLDDEHCVLDYLIGAPHAAVGGGTGTHAMDWNAGADAFHPTLPAMSAPWSVEDEVFNPVDLMPPPLDFVVHHQGRSRLPPMEREIINQDHAALLPFLPKCSPRKNKGKAGGHVDGKSGAVTKPKSGASKPSTPKKNKKKTQTVLKQEDVTFDPSMKPFGFDRMLGSLAYRPKPTTTKDSNDDAADDDTAEVSENAAGQVEASASSHQGPHLPSL